MKFAKSGYPNIDMENVAKANNVAKIIILVLKIYYTANHPKQYCVTYITSKQTDEYSREMLISSIILKPREDGGEEIEIPAAGGEANKRKGIQSITSNTRK